MADIIDLQKKLEALRDNKEPSAEYYDRYKNCAKRADENDGLCDCDLCLTKEEFADQLIRIGEGLFVDYTEETGKSLYYGDLFEVFITATLKLRDYCTKPHPPEDPTEKDPKGAS